MERSDIARAKLEILVTLPKAPLLSAKEEAAVARQISTLSAALAFCKPFAYYCPREAASKDFQESLRGRSFEIIETTGWIDKPVQIRTDDKATEGQALLYPRLEKNDFFAPETLRVAAQALCVLHRHGLADCKIQFPVPDYGDHPIPPFTPSNPADAKATLAQLGEALAPFFVIEPPERCFEKLDSLRLRRGRKTYGAGTCSG